MRRRILFVDIIILMIIVSSVFVLAASSNIKGRITDSTTGDGLLGANVVLAGTSMGSATDLDGMYLIPNVPSGSYTLRISYIGYKTEEIKIEVKDGESVKKDIKLNSVSIEGQTITITAQASGQNSSINQQLSSNKIVNVVSSDRIQELPDVNAAESVGRLPGVSVTRSGGEANGVIIRGLQPKYNMIMIDGVEMAATNSGDRSTDLSMISSNSLSGIEVYKTLTPDMDAATLGGVVNFEIREAKSSPTGAPLIELQAQGGYTDLVSSFGNYKFIGSIENRYFNDNLGVFVQVIAEKLNHTDDELGGSYMQPYPVEQPNLVALKNLDISFNPLDKRRYDATLVLDYKLPDGKISLMNLFSSGKTVTTNFDQIYNSGSSNSISYNIGYTNNTLNAFTNILHYQQTLFSIKVDAKLSNSYSENHDPQDWNMDFWQNAAGIGNINNGAGPVEFAKEANAHLNINPRDNTYGMFFDAFNVSNSFTKQQNIAGSIDLERTFNFSDMITAIFKAGVQLKYTSRWHSENSSRAGLYYPAAKNSREAVAAAFPWMTQAPYYVKADGSSQLPFAAFIDPNFNYGKFLGGDYAMGPGTNTDLIFQVMKVVMTTSQNGNWDGSYVPNQMSLFDNNYYGHENRDAAYIMSTVNIGSDITIIPGIRYQGLETSYNAPRITSTSFNQAWPAIWPYKDTTVSRYHGYLLPDVSLRYRALSWFDVRLSYTSTLVYPDFNQIDPVMILGTNSINWHNTELKPVHSQNYDASMSFYNNSIGLLTVGGFLKQIDDFIFSTGSRYRFPSNISAYPGIPVNLLNPKQIYSISTTINDPYRVNLWGAEVDWQTHFWYLPSPLNGLVFNINYTHIFSSAKYPWTYNYTTPYPSLKTVYVDTFYTNRLIDQPNDIVNATLGFDYKDFSTRFSMEFQSNIFTSANNVFALTSYKNRYLRFDLSAKQELPWFGIEAYFDISNLTGESDVHVIQGSDFPASTQDYGLIIDLGLRWKL